MARWSVVALVFAAIMLNYVDRQIIALLKPTLQAEFGWSDRDYGHMASAFQFAAAIGYLGAGWFLDRVGLKRGFALGVGVWSLAGAAHAVVGGVAGFIGARAVLGVAEATGTPAVVKTAATYFGPAERTRMLGISNMAPNIGAVAAPLLIPPIALAFGWRATFLGAGTLGLVWVALWLALRAPVIEASAEVAEKVRWGTLLRERRTWGLVCAKALTDQVWWLLLFFMPDLFHRMFGIAQGTVGLPVALVYAMAAAGSLAGGWLPGVLIARGKTPAVARKWTMLIAALLVLPLPLVLAVPGAWAAAGLLGLALFAHQGFSTNLFATATDLFPTTSVGTAIGIAAFAGNLAGMAMLEFAGWSLDAHHGYLPMLAVGAVSYLLALGLLQLLARPA
jgi:ACS family hexuronate transporter-like MFS transporter